VTGVTRGPGELLIMADGRGSDGSRCCLWKVALQDLANRVGTRTGLKIRAELDRGT
jgi:hypothetical protein